MADRVLLINHGTAFLTNALVASLKSIDIVSVQVEPVIEDIEALKSTSEVFLLFAGDFVYESPELLVYLKDLCFSEGKSLCVVGYSKEITEVESFIPKNMIEYEFARPIDVKLLSSSIHALIAAGEGRKKEKRILIVDDDVTFLKTIQAWLSEKYSVTAVKSGMQAITYIAAHTPDLILLDYEMPVTPGPQVLEMIKSEPTSSRIPVIFLTGKNDRDSVLSVMHLKPDGYLLKTAGKVGILSAVNDFLQQKAMADADMTRRR